MNKLKYIKNLIYSYLRLFNYFFISSKRKDKFKSDLKKIEYRLKKKINFAFTRFSDGELFIIQNKKLIISNNFWILSNKKIKAKFSSNEKKSFLPTKHQFFRKKLINSLKFNKKNYFKGISCTCCNGIKDVNYMKKISGNKNITFSNLLQNGNYNRFAEVTLNLFKKKNIIFIANENASFQNLPFKVIKIFKVGQNCFIKNYSLIAKLKKFIITNKIKNYIFLISASSLSNLIIYELFKDRRFENNTYIDIGSAFNYFLFKDKKKNSRSYLNEYWYKKKDIEYLNRSCYW